MTRRAEQLRCASERLSRRCERDCHARRHAWCTPRPGDRLSGDLQPARSAGARNCR